MNEKTMKTSSRKIENKITLVTSVMGAIIVNIIWIAGIKESRPTIQTSFSQNEIKKEIQKVEMPKFSFSASLGNSNMEY